MVAPSDAVEPDESNCTANALGAAPITATGLACAALTVTDFVIESVIPWLSVTWSVTVYVPAVS